MKRKKNDKKNCEHNNKNIEKVNMNELNCELIGHFIRELQTLVELA